MARRTILAITLVTAAAAVGCSSAYAHGPARVAPVLLPSSSATPYCVTLVGENGGTLNTYRHRGRYYVLGGSGGRYSIQVHNPTAQRIEAVVSVDGLDVIDGQTANVGKRGYVINPYDTVTIDGFRTSTTNVAAFRFSSVANSYAGRKGKARHVGVIGVAIFEERVTQQQIPIPRHDYRRHQEFDDWGNRGGGVPSRSAPSRDAESSMDEAPSAPRGHSKSSRPAPQDECLGCGPSLSQRPGLGTEFGESRYSSVGYTRFVRRAGRPNAVAELRYNDASGLRALGIQLNPNYYDHDELYTRETATPFPGSFASPPPY